MSGPGFEQTCRVQVEEWAAGWGAWLGAGGGEMSVARLVAAGSGQVRARGERPWETVVARPPPPLAAAGALVPALTRHGPAVTLASRDVQHREFAEAVLCPGLCRVCPGLCRVLHVEVLDEMGEGPWALEREAAALRARAHPCRCATPVGLRLADPRAVAALLAGGAPIAGGCW